MVSYLVMKNNIRRLIVRKSTYILMLVIPLCLVFIGSISVRIEDKQIRVGILGSKEYIDYVAEELQNQEGISYQIADIETIHADTIMGKYHYVLKEQDSDNVLQNIKMTVKQKRDERMTVHAVRQCMLSVLLPVYMTIATLYGMKYLQDKRELALERVLVSGGTRRGYLMGCFLSNSVITGIQLVVILMIWNLFDEKFSFSLFQTGIILFFTLIVSNIYGILVSMLSKSEMMAGVLGSSGAALCSLLGGTFIAVADMPRLLQVLSMLSPINWLMQLL